MIIAKLKGGLGNQMFQYALGRVLSLKNSDTLKLDASGYGERGGDTMRHYTLDKFSLDVEMATRDEIQKLKYPFGIVSKGWRFFKFKFLRQFNAGFYPCILRKKGDIYLDGFWQTYKYMPGHEDTIRNDFGLRDPISQSAAAIAEKIKGGNGSTVSLHVRRGDYISSPRENAYHGSYDNDYYSLALKRVATELAKRSISTFQVFVFSDGMDWVKENIKIPYPTIYVPDNIPDYEQLTLMAKCDHHIIANSSFSWWGAWLNPNMDKTVIAPKRWVKKSEWRHKDTVPPAWIRI